MIVAPASKNALHDVEESIRLYGRHATLDIIKRGIDIDQEPGSVGLAVHYFTFIEWTKSLPHAPKSLIDSIRAQHLIGIDRKPDSSRSRNTGQGNATKRGCETI